MVERNRRVAAARDPTKKPKGPDPDPAAQAVNAKTIVVVDDELDLVDSTVMILEAAGHTAHGATHAPGGLALVVEHIADLVLLDYMMPNMTGAALGKALRSHPVMGQIKIVMVSGTAEDVVRAEFDQFDVFLQKPVHPDRLLRTVEALW